MKFAPSKVGLVLWFRLKRFGRQDRRIHSGSLDTTRTHAIQWLQGLVRAGQHAVNADYLNLATKSAAAAAQMESQLAVLNAELSNENKLLQNRAGRDRDRAQTRIKSLERQLNELQAQIAVNSKKNEMNQATAGEALASWSTFYEQAASVYLRSRLKIRGAQPSQSGVPALDAVKLVDVSQELKMDG